MSSNFPLQTSAKMKQINKLNLPTTWERGGGHLSTHPSSYPPIYKVHAAATPTHPTHVTLLPPSHCGHSAQDIAMYPSSNTQISHADRLFAQKNCVQTLGITHPLTRIPNSSVLLLLCHKKAGSNFFFMPRGKS